MTEKDINIEDEETLEEAPVEETATENEEAKAEEPAEEKDPLEQAQAEIEELKNQLLYKAAEFDNYRKRTLKERAELILNPIQNLPLLIWCSLPIMSEAIKGRQPCLRNSLRQWIWERWWTLCPIRP